MKHLSMETLKLMSKWNTAVLHSPNRQGLSNVFSPPAQLQDSSLSQQRQKAICSYSPNCMLYSILFLVVCSQWILHKIHTCSHLEITQCVFPNLKRKQKAKYVCNILFYCIGFNFYVFMYFQFVQVCLLEERIMSIFIWMITTLHI